MDTGADLPVELMAEVVFAHIKPIRQHTEGQRFPVVEVDVVHHLGDRPAGAGRRPAALLGRQAVDQHQQFRQKACPHQFRTVAALPCLLPQPLEQGLGQGALLRPQLQEVAAGDLPLPEAEPEIRLIRGEAAQHMGRHPQHIPLIGGQFCLDADLVQFPRADQQQIPRHHMAETAFDDIGDIAGHQEVDLVEIVVVQFHLVQADIPFEVQFKIRTAHVLPGIESVGVPHGNASFLRRNVPFRHAVTMVYPSRGPVKEKAARFTMYPRKSRHFQGKTLLI